jgi:hypothetical protein
MVDDVDWEKLPIPPPEYPLGKGNGEFFYKVFLLYL